jgi:hypothetical protein
MIEASSSMFLSGVWEEQLWNEFEEKNTSAGGIRVMSGSFIRTTADVGASGSVRNTASSNRDSDSAGTSSGIPGVDEGELSPPCAASA